MGAITETVEVTGVAAVPQTDSSEHGHLINTQQVELPLNGRNCADLALLSTTVVRSPMGVLFAASGAPREAAFNITECTATYNNFLLDGLGNNAYSPSNQAYSSQVVKPSPRCHFRVQSPTSNFSAEYVGGEVIGAALWHHPDPRFRLRVLA